MKLLVLDIETSPHLSWHWKRWNENIPPSYTEEESRVICWAAKWLGERKVEFSSEWDDGADYMIIRVFELLDECDAVVHYNGKKFDIKRLNTEFIERGWGPPSPYDQIDLYQQVRKHFKFSSNKLAHVLDRLGLSPKLTDNVVFQLWKDVQNGSKKARNIMEKYNRQDVGSTEELYDWILGWITPHPNWGLYVDDVTDPNNPVCPNCGERHLRRHKVRKTRVRTYRQWHCGSCGKYSRGRRSLEGVSPDDTGVVL